MIAESIIEQLKTAGIKLRRSVGIEPTERELVQMIHDEFDTAPERLLAGVPATIARLDDRIARTENSKSAVDPVLKAKVERLKALGFTNTEDSERLAEQIESETQKGIGLTHLKNAKKDLDGLADQISYYKSTYPFAIFLTIDELDRICEKYGLIHAPVNTFIGTVPEKNLREIEKAQPLKLSDLPPRPIRFFWTGVDLTIEEAIHQVRATYKITEFRGTRVEELLKYLNGSAPKIPKRNADVWNTAGVSGSWILPPGAFDSSFLGLSSPQLFTGEWSTGDNGFFLSPNTEFQIAAPPAEFKLDENIHVKTGKYGYQVKNDPIVFKYCRGGILVYSKWGLEASDPALINPIEN